jgi:hypothetical protein
VRLGFEEVSKAIGAIDAIVSLGIGNVHPALVLPALFVVAVAVLGYVVVLALWVSM